MKNKTNIEDVFSNAISKGTYIKVCAPMVRYSKVQFRTLVNNFGVDLCFTPMILADSFCQNAKARQSEFSTTANDTPLIVQFAANNHDDLIDASKLVYPYADGVDLNCGCPQRWAMKDGYGCALLSKPEVVEDLVKGIRSNLPNEFSVSVKIRLSKDLKQTIVLCQQLERCGVNFVTVHGRTPLQKNSDQIDISSLKDICDSLQIPIIANGGVKSLNDADNLHESVKCCGVMAASGLLTNPALFTGANQTPSSCVKLWMEIKDQCCDRITFQCYHHHLVFMLEKVLTRKQRQVFNCLKTFQAVDDFILEHIFKFNVVNSDVVRNFSEYIQCDFNDEITMKHSYKCRGCFKSAHYCICPKYNYNTTDGNYFMSHVKENCDSDMFNNMFDEPYDIGSFIYFQYHVSFIYFLCLQQLNVRSQFVLYINRQDHSYGPMCSQYLTIKKKSNLCATYYESLIKQELI